MTIHMLKTPTTKEHPNDVVMWCGKVDWRYARYTHVFMIEYWINEPIGVDICKDCWNALHKRIGEKYEEHNVNAEG